MACKNVTIVWRVHGTLEGTWHTVAEIWEDEDYAKVRALELEEAEEARVKKEYPDATEWDGFWAETHDVHHAGGDRS